METWTLFAHILALFAVLGLGALLAVLGMFVFVCALLKMENKD
jgi:hypothetical protein